MTVEAGIGTVNVLHRLALGVECRDPLTDRLLVAPVRAGLEGVPSAQARPGARAWPCIALGAGGPSRFRLSYDRPLPTTLVLRLDDPRRRVVARRLRVTRWQPDELDGTPARRYVDVAHRLLRVWLWPGAAVALPTGTTVVRGRVVRDGGPARWARVRALGPLGGVAGLAHADDRGEFVLVVTSAQQAPLEATIPLELHVTAPAVAPPVDPDDPCADLPVEPAPAMRRPPAAAVLDSPLLRGVDPPPGHVANTRNPSQVAVPTGAELILPDDLVFAP